MILAIPMGTVIAAEPQNQVQMHFFWSAKCPHCREALPFVRTLKEEWDWLDVRSHELTSNRDNVSLYVEMAAKAGEEARSVPAFFICGRMYVGYDNPEGVGKILRQAILDCRQGTQPTMALPVLPGGIDPNRMSLPLFTLAIAALDAFNPCAFFVLLFLLSLMVNVRSRWRMVMVGGVYVFISGLVYFLFMAAWLELFLLVGALSWVTALAGSLALVIGGLNIKDFFLFRQGPSLAIPESAKPGLFARMRGLVSAENLPTMLIGTVVLAVAANSYELLCTAGFPMIYTRVLTLQASGTAAYYLYLLFYNLIYITPLLAIVLIFTATMGRRKLSEREGRGLKLLSGLMMAGLGLLLLVAPETLNSLATSLILLAVAVGVTLLLLALYRHDKPETVMNNMRG